MKLAQEYGPIYWLDMLGKPVVIVSGFELVDELCDESRFDKSVRGALRRLRDFAGDGLFTAYTQEPNWSRAHNILLPSFGQRAMQGYHPMMLDIAEQLVLKWDRLNADDEIDVTHDMTSLTLDTIGLCGFGYRFNSFYRESPHPFVGAMIGALGTSMETRGLPLETMLKKDRERKLRADIRYMNEMVDRIVRERRESGDDLADKPDLLSHMLSGVDRKTGERLDDLNIRYQVITFLIAGHETTSGLLSFAVYYLLNNPDVLARASAEVDRVLGPGSGGVTHLRPGQSARLPRADPEGIAPALAHRAGVRAIAVQGRDDWRSVPDAEELPDRGAEPHAPPRPEGVGRAGRRLQPRQLQPGGGATASRQRLQALRQWPAGLHRPAVRPAGGGARPRDDPPALQAHRSHALPAHPQGDPHGEAGPVPHQGPAPHRPRSRGDGTRGRHHEHGRGGGRPRRAGRARLSPGPPDPAPRAVRVEPRHRRGGRAAHRRGRRGARLRGDRRVPRRVRRPAAPRGGRPHHHRVLQRHAPRQCRALLRLAARRRARPRSARRRPLRGVRLRQPRLGRDVPGRPPPDRCPPRGAWRPASTPTW